MSLPNSRDGMTMVVVTDEMGFGRTVADRVEFMDHGASSRRARCKAFFRNRRTSAPRHFQYKSDPTALEFRAMAMPVAAQGIGSESADHAFLCVLRNRSL